MSISCGLRRSTLSLRPFCKARSTTIIIHSRRRSNTSQGDGYFDDNPLVQDALDLTKDKEQIYLLQLIQQNRVLQKVVRKNVPVKPPPPPPSPPNPRQRHSGIQSLEYICTETVNEHDLQAQADSVIARLERLSQHCQDLQFENYPEWRLPKVLGLSEYQLDDLDHKVRADENTLKSTLDYFCDTVVVFEDALRELEAGKESEYKRILANGVQRILNAKEGVYADKADVEPTRARGDP